MRLVVGVLHWLSGKRRRDASFGNAVSLGIGARFLFAEVVHEIIEFSFDALDIDLGEIYKQVFDDEIENIADLFEGEEFGVGEEEVLGISAFQQPGGGAPVAILSGSDAECAEQVDFGGLLGGGQLGGELGIAVGGAGDRAGRTADEAGRDPPAAAVGDHRDDLPAFLFVQYGAGGVGGHSGRRTVGGGPWTVDSGRWTVRRQNIVYIFTFPLSSGVFGRGVGGRMRDEEE